MNNYSEQSYNIALNWLRPLVHVDKYWQNQLGADLL